MTQPGGEELTSAVASKEPLDLNCIPLEPKLAIKFALKTQIGFFTAKLELEALLWRHGLLRVVLFDLLNGLRQADPALLNLKLLIEAFRI